jgi:hypothetical protein
VKDAKGNVAGRGTMTVYLDDLKAMLQQVAKEGNVDLATATVDEKRELLKRMGYESYFGKLREESEFAWL